MNVGRIVAALGLAAGAVLVARRVGEAHAMLLSSEPAANAKLTTAPARIRLVFSEAVDPSVSSIQLVVGTTTQALAVAGDSQKKAALVAPLPALAAGEYRVVWRTVSVDGHRVDGSYLFSVESAAPAMPVAPAAVMPPAAPSSVAANGTTTAGLARGLAMALSMALAGLLFFARGRMESARIITVCLWLSAAALVAISVHFLLWTMGASPTSHLDLSWVGKMARTTQGKVEVARCLTSVGAALSLVLVRRGSAALAFAVGTVLISAGIGHPAADLPIVAVPAMAIHLLAGAAWFGGLLWILLADRTDRERFQDGALRVSRVALWAVAAVVVTGVTESLIIVQPLSGLIATGYGRLLLVKIAIAVLLVLMGGYHRYRTMPRVAGGGDFGMSLRLEIIGMIAVLTIAGLLSYLSPHLS